VVCLSVVCHSRAPRLNRSTEIDGIWQVHLWSPITHRVRWRSLPHREKGDLWVERPAKACNCKQLMPPGEYKREVGWTCHSQSFRFLPIYFGPCWYFALIYAITGFTGLGCFLVFLFFFAFMISTRSLNVVLKIVSCICARPTLNWRYVYHF